MGDGDKLLESERPSIDYLWNVLNSKISKKLQNLFVIDLQTDCACATETYDATESALCTSLNGIKEQIYGDRICLQMKKDICDQEIIDLLDAACKKASDKLVDLIPKCMLYNPNSDVKKLWEMFEKHCYPVTVSRSGIKWGWNSFDFVPEDCVYFLPQPEFFGVITANVDKFGALCFPKSIMRKEL